MYVTFKHLKIGTFHGVFQNSRVKKIFEILSYVISFYSNEAGLTFHPSLATVILSILFIV